MTTPHPAQDSPIDSATQSAWLPVVAACYGIAATAAVQFLGAGFHSIDHLQRALGGFTGTAMARDAGMFVVLVIVTGLAVPLARRRLERASSGSDIARHLIWCLACAAVAAFPPVQWLTFGRPDPSPTTSAAVKSAPSVAAQSLPAGLAGG